MNFLSYRDCLHLDKPDRLCHLYGDQPRQIYQEVFGRPPSQDELDQIVQHGQLNGKAAIDLDPAAFKQFLQGTPQGVQNQAMTMANQAQAAQIEANKPAIATLQAQGSSLGDQYKTLLNSVLAQGSATYNTAVSGENAFLGARGLLSQAGRGNNELSQAENAVNTTNATNAGQVTTAAANAQVPISQAVASLQAGNLPQAENFAGNVFNTQASVTNTNTQAQEALQQAQLAAAKPFQVGNIVFNPAGNSFSYPKGGGGGEDGGSMDAITLAHAILKGKKPQARQPIASINQFVQPS